MTTLDKLIKIKTYSFCIFEVTFLENKNENKIIRKFVKLTVRLAVKLFSFHNACSKYKNDAEFVHGIHFLI